MRKAGRLHKNGTIFTYHILHEYFFPLYQHDLLQTRVKIRSKNNTVKSLIIFHRHVCTFHRHELSLGD